MDQFTRYRALVSQLAGSALQAVSAALSERTLGDDALAQVVPAARGLLAASTDGVSDGVPDGVPGEAEALSAVLPATLERLERLARVGEAAGEAVGEAPPRLVTLTGQSRPVYYPLAVHLVLRVLERRGDRESAEVQTLREPVRRAVAPMARALRGAVGPGDREGSGGVALRLWQALCVLEAAALVGAMDEHAGAARAVVDQVVEAGAGAGEGAGPLHRQEAVDQLDAWTYRELAGVHALDRLAARSGEPRWRRCVEEVTRYHLEHTQPDYTTYEPWGVAAFGRSAETVIFVDQQLHDVATNLQLSGAASGLMPSLLLADAVDALPG